MTDTETEWRLWQEETHVVTYTAVEGFPRSSVSHGHERCAQKQTFCNHMTTSRLFGWAWSMPGPLYFCSCVLLPGAVAWRKLCSFSFSFPPPTHPPHLVHCPQSLVSHRMCCAHCVADQNLVGVFMWNSTCIVIVARWRFLQLTRVIPDLPPPPHPTTQASLPLSDTLTSEKNLYPAIKVVWIVISVP